MKLTRFLIIGIMAALPALPASNQDSAGVQMVITARPVKGVPPSQTLEPSELTVQLGNAVAPVTSLQRLSGDLANMQLFILLDDSTSSSSLAIQLRELKAFIESAPATTQIAIGYMQHGSFGQQQAFTSDHEKAARALRLPVAIPGENGSPYFALSDLAKHWPSKESTGRRAVLMLTDGVDRYYTSPTTDNPYVNAAIHDLLKQDITVYSIYLRGAGLYGRSNFATNLAQSLLIEVSHETGGNAYFQGFTDPVTIAPFLTDLQNRFDNQYRVKIEVLHEKGMQPVKVRTEIPGLKLEAPTHVYLQ